MWHIKVPASTANLGSGFDSLGMALSIYLECWFTLDDSLAIEVRGEGRGMIPETSDNLVWRTADTLYRHVTGSPMPTGRLKVVSQIPLARGLGSSAAAIVAGLLLANTVLEKRLTVDELMEWALKLEGHPDNVAAALYGGFVFAWNDGRRVHVHHYRSPELKVLLIIPSFHVSTEAARQVLPTQVSLEDALFNSQRLALWIHAVSQRDWSLLRYAGEDRLHQPYREALVPGMRPIIEGALAAGAEFAALSGSGPTMIALVSPDRLEGVRRRVFEIAEAVFPEGFTVHETAPSPWGAQSVLDSWRWRSASNIPWHTRLLQTSTQV
ncbi:homoserine kinase [Sulfobacillus acidophilus TPY]|uniref:Homoserine kinase n=1 Tax=Sulfobacillus acidophilus (strain ATCC 700253 / DSM 10332 / NAL) TaxID=679936 RepID=G8TSS2_SULAD|nr:homoserine kinase [Sulfobacillus acidophilus TPY]AEW04449.1 homoserine kinase [Sulfobacillus acidophilus DSM 10332]